MTGFRTVVKMTMCFHIRRPGSVVGLATPALQGSQSVLWSHLLSQGQTSAPGAGQGRPQPRTWGSPVRLQPPPCWTGWLQVCSALYPGPACLRPACRMSAGGTVGNEAGVSLTRPPHVDGAAGGQPCRQQTHRPHGITGHVWGVVSPARTGPQLVQDRPTFHHPSLLPELTSPGGMTSAACRFAHLLAL